MLRGVIFGNCSGSESNEPSSINRRLTAQRIFAEDGIDPLDKKLGRRPIVEDRHQNCQWEPGRKFRLQVTIGGVGIRLRGGHDNSSLVIVDFGRGEYMPMQKRLPSKAEI